MITNINKKTIIIITSAVLAVIVASICAWFLIGALKKFVPTDAPFSSNVSSLTSEVTPESVPEEVETGLVITSPSKLNSTTTDSFIVITGTSDPEAPLTMNGNTVERSADGSFILELNLERGKNTFSFVHKDKTTVCTVTYRYVVINFYSPSKKEQYPSGSTFVVSATARAGATVKATFNGSTITLNQQGNPPEGSDFISFTGSFTLPNDNESDINMGKVKFTGTFDGTTENFFSKDIICLKNEILANTSYVAEIVAHSAETFNGSTADDYSNPTLNYLPQGTVDYCMSGMVYDSESGNSYIKLRCGRRVYVDKSNSPDSGRVQVTRKYKGSLPDHNEIGVASVDDSGRHTVITLDTMWKAPFLLDVKPQSYTSLKNRNYTVSNTTYEYVEITFCYATIFRGQIDIPKNNPIFSRAEVVTNSENTTVRLYLKNKGAFYGWDCSYNEMGQLVFEFLNPVRTEAANNKYGIDLTGVKILIDAGHGGKDPGALGREPSKHPEAERNLALANKIKAELESLGATVVMTRTANTTLSADERCRILRREKPDYCIAIHHDSNAKPSANGFGSFHFNAFSSDAAKYVLNRTAAAGIYGKTQLKWHYFYLARMSSCPVVLTENGFISSTADYPGIADDATNMKKAQAIVNGIADYFKGIRDAARLPEPDAPIDPNPDPEPTPTPTPDPGSNPESGENGDNGDNANDGENNSQESSLSSST